MKRFIVKGIAAIIVVGALAFPPVTSVFAAGNPSGTGQPGQTCLSNSAPSEPGNASSSPGSPFNEPTDTSPGGTAGSVYAGNGVSADHANSANAVSQYDVACFQVSQPHP
jgi:hypothetical protein